MPLQDPGEATCADTQKSLAVCAVLVVAMAFRFLFDRATRFVAIMIPRSAMNILQFFPGVHFEAFSMQCFVT